MLQISQVHPKMVHKVCLLFLFCCIQHTMYLWAWDWSAHFGVSSLTVGFPRHFNEDHLSATPEFSEQWLESRSKFPHVASWNRLARSSWQMAHLLSLSSIWKRYRFFWGRGVFVSGGHHLSSSNESETKCGEELMCHDLETVEFSWLGECHSMLLLWK